MSKDEFENKINDFIKKISTYKKVEAVFNPWRESDKYDKKNLDTAEIRCKNLNNYLKERQNAKYILIGEAPGYRGCKFSGIPFTSERILENNRNFKESDFKCTSDRKTTWAEPTATIVWKAMNELQISCTDWVAWNAFPFHPYNQEKGYLSNIKKKKGFKKNIELLEKSEGFLKDFINLFSSAIIITVGDRATQALISINKEYKNKIKYTHVTHPANGGKKEFIKALRDYIKE